MSEIPATILVVDDEVKNVKLMEALLLPRGYRVITATHGEEALQRVSQERPDLILLDVMMPIMDGFETCKRLKDDPETRLIPVVIMTALGQVEGSRQGHRSRGRRFPYQTVHRDELLARIRTSLRLKQTIDHQMSVLQGIQGLPGKFVPQSVQRLVAANPEAPELEKREQDVSVLFVDIRGYTH